MLTFELWQATRKSEPCPPVYRYVDGSIISKNDGRAIDDQGRYSLTIGGWTECSNNLHELELKLYTGHYLVEHKTYEMLDNWEANDDRNCIDSYNGTEV